MSFPPRTPAPGRKRQPDPSAPGGETMGSGDGSDTSRVGTTPGTMVSEASRSSGLVGKGMWNEAGDA